MARLVDIVRDARPELAITDAFAQTIESRFAVARGAWPEITIDDSRFAHYIAARITAPIETALDRLEIEDLYLACACVDGIPAAIAAFDRTCKPVVEHAVMAVGASTAEAADLCQVVRQRLLVPPATEAGEPGEPRIASYTGRASLASWVRVVATREAQRLLPRERREPHAEDDSIDRLLAADDDLELGYMKRLYRAEFRIAVAAAIATLTDKERLLLQQHALDGLGIDRLAKFHKVHRATAARWLEAARQAVLDGTRRELLRRLELTRDELDSVMRLIASQLSVSLPRLLQIKA